MTKSSVVPAVAIITRTKNRPQFLERCIKSVLAQTERDFVHVILNDGGDKAEVEAVLARYPDARRQVIHNKESVGLSRGLNQAIRNSKSKFITILDDDDAWHEDRLLLGLRTMRDRGARASVIPMDIVIEDINDEGSITEIERRRHPESWCGEVSLFKQAHRNYLSNGAVMYTRDLYDELEGYDETLLTAEDWDFGIRLMLKSNVEQVDSDAALMYYHQRPRIQDADTGNSVHAGVREQERTIMKLRNDYLRRDILNGVFGIGYIMNHSEQELINLERVEGHINRTSAELKQAILDRVNHDVEHLIRKHSFYDALKRKFRKNS